VVDLEKLGPRTMWIDCDVLQADGGTRTAAITGASLAVAVACRKLADEKKIDAPPIRKLVAAVSAGVLNGESILDLNYEEDKGVSVDFNLVATEDGEFVELQVQAKKQLFRRATFRELRRKERDRRIDRRATCGPGIPDGGTWLVYDNEKKALITGITGQDGELPADLLIEKGYEVHGHYCRARSTPPASITSMPTPTSTVLVPALRRPGGS
jgi:hypothetical protein